MCLKQTRSGWSEFLWYETVVKAGHPKTRYFQLSRMKNGRHSPQFYEELTFFDVLHNLRTEYNSLVRLGDKATGEMVAKAFGSN